jgi:hypothetical protein
LGRWLESERPKAEHDDGPLLLAARLVGVAEVVIDVLDLAAVGGLAAMYIEPGKLAALSGVVAGWPRY